MRNADELNQSDHSDADAIEEAYDAIDDFEKRRKNHARNPINFPSKIIAA